LATTIRDPNSRSNTGHDPSVVAPHSLAWKLFESYPRTSSG
jgi:hypothetical protein